MILDFKARLFAKETKLPRREIDPGDPLWEERITSFFDDAHGLPPAGSPEEYATAFEAVYLDAADKRQYKEDAIQGCQDSMATLYFQPSGVLRL